MLTNIKHARASVLLDGRIDYPEPRRSRQRSGVVGQQPDCGQPIHPDAHTEA